MAYLGGPVKLFYTVTDITERKECTYFCFLPLPSLLVSRALLGC